MEGVVIVNFKGADIGLKSPEVIVEVFSLPEIDIFQVDYENIVSKNCLRGFSR